jgi:CHAD domain-containing protein
MRDAKILFDTLDALVRDASAEQRRGLDAVREALEVRRARVRHRVMGDQETLAFLIRGLRRAKRRIRSSDCGSAGWSVLGRGMRRVYRAGRRAFTVASREPTDERLHEWRKQTKYLWHQLQFLHPIRPALMKRLADRAHQLSDRLGDDHDLAVLRHRIVTARPRVSRAVTISTVDGIERRRASLQADAMALGWRVYADRPREFTRRLEEPWREWRSAGRREPCR